MLVFEVFIFQQSEDTQSYQNGEFLGTLLALFLWESLIYEACLNKWGFILFLSWRSDEKPFLNIVKYTRLHSLQSLYTLSLSSGNVKGSFSPPFLVTSTYLACSLPGKIHGVDIDRNSWHSLLCFSEIMCEGGHFPF